MLLSEKKEREYRFKLALRIGLPIFALVIVLLLKTILNPRQDFDALFYTISILLVAFSIYFILYIIYNSFDIRITEVVTKVFTREYLYKYLKKEIKNTKDYTLILISVDNLEDINNRFGLNNGDKVLKDISLWVVEYLKDNGLSNFPLGHIKGGDFIIGLKGKKSEYKVILELMCLKSDNYMVDDIEVKILGSIVDTNFSNDLEYLVEDLFIQKEAIKNKRLIRSDTHDVNPNELEVFVVNAIKNRLFIVIQQDVFQKDIRVIKESFVKLKSPNGDFIHQKVYMKVLDKLGLMADYDLMILEYHILNFDNSNGIIAMSISPSSLRNKHFLYKAKELIRSNIEIKNRFIFLLNEHQYYSQIDRYNNTLKSLRKMGILIAIERVGAIHTSFLYMRDLDIDIIRFDSSYTKDITDVKNKNIIEGFNVMAHAKGIKTWVKMIESDDMKTQAQMLNIDYIQGKYLAPLEIKYES